MSDHDTLIAHGLAWHEINEEWPKINANLDAGSVVPLGLVHGQEPPTVGFFTGIQDLGGCHVVLAWGYDLSGTSLTINIYDPDALTDSATIKLNIGNSAHTTPISVSAWPDGTFRGFFETHYQAHDPRTPASGSFIGTIVSSPGISSAGPIITPPPPPPPVLRDIVVTVTPTPRLGIRQTYTVTVKDAGNGAPVSGALVGLENNGHSSTTISSATGMATFSGVILANQYIIDPETKQKQLVLPSVGVEANGFYPFDMNL